MRIVEIGREVVTGMGWSLAHVDDGISHLRWQALDMFRTPGIVVPSRAAASERGLIGKAKKQKCSSHCRWPRVKSPHASLPSLVEDDAFARQRLSGTGRPPVTMNCPNLCAAHQFVQVPWPSMFVSGHSRRFDRPPVTSGPPRLADILSVRRHVSKVPCVDGSGLARTFFTYAGLGQCSHVFGL